MMNKREERNMFTKALRIYGFDAQAGMLMEESAELIVAMNKYLRNPSDINSLKDLAEEVADVEIMISQLKQALIRRNKFCNLINSSRTEKMLRLRERLRIEDNKIRKVILHKEIEKGDL